MLVYIVGTRIPVDWDREKESQLLDRMDLSLCCEGGSMVPVISAPCEGWSYDSDRSCIQILGIRSHHSFSGSTPMSMLDFLIQSDEKLTRGRGRLE